VEQAFHARASARLATEIWIENRATVWQIRDPTAGRYWCGAPLAKGLPGVLRGAAVGFKRRHNFPMFGVLFSDPDGASKSPQACSGAADLIEI
jgi:hypothetical protein